MIPACFRHVSFESVHIDLTVKQSREMSRAGLSSFGYFQVVQIQPEVGVTNCATRVAEDGKVELLNNKNAYNLCFTLQTCQPPVVSLVVSNSQEQPASYGENLYRASPDLQH